MAARADGPAIVDGSGHLTWQDLSRLAEGYAAQLAASGVRRGDRVALYLTNSADHLALIFAVARLGAIAVHINPRFRTHELGSLLRRTAAAILVTETAGNDDYAALLASVPPLNRAALRRVLVRSASPVAIAGIPVERLQPGGTIPDAALPDDPCAILTTTGSTGEPKLVLHGQRQIAAQYTYAARVLGLDRPGATLLASLPFCGIYGFSRCIAAVAGRATIVLQYGADPGALIRRHQVTHASGFGDVLARLLDLAAGRPLKSLRLFSAASSPLVDNDAVRRRAEALGITVGSGYGSTETLSLFAVGPEGWRLGQGGVPVHPEARFIICDPHTGAEMPEGEPGALFVSSPSLFLEYYDDPAATAASRTADGWFRTADRAYRIGNALVFLGRFDEAIRLGNYLLDPAEVEAFLRTRPEIALARVVGVEGRIVAFVIPRDRARFREPDLLEVCRDGMAPFKVPARIVALDAFPLAEGANATKIRLDVLRDMAASLLRGAADDPTARQVA